MPSPEESAFLDFDQAATTPLAPAARRAMEPFFSARAGNPSSRHRAGVAAGRALEEARTALAQLCEAAPEEVVFTGGGTEANNLAVLGLARRGRRHGRHVLIGAGEHPSVAAAAEALRTEGFEIEHIPSAERGALDLEALERLLRKDTVLVSQMLVDNVVGTIHPLARVARLVRARAPEARVHTDAIQALGKLPLALVELGVDALSLSAHKVGGPKGVGALVLARGARPRPLVHGGGQEHGLRPGTENVAGIAGFAAAALATERERVAFQERAERLRALLARGLAALPGARVLEPGGAEGGVPSILALQLPGPPAEVWLHHLEQAGVYTSVGSACQARARAVPAALLAYGLDAPRARQVLRLSFGPRTTEEVVERALAGFRASAKALAGLGPEQGTARAHAAPIPRPSAAKRGTRR